MKNTLFTVAILVAIFLTGMGFDRYVVGTECIENPIDTVWNTKIVVKEVEPVEVEPEYIIREIPGKPANIDSLWKAAKDYWADKYKDSVKTETAVEYTAEVDTTLDSGRVELKMQFISPIPIHPDSYFKIRKFSYQYPEITKKIEKKKTFWDWIIPKPSLQAGVGVGLIHKEFDFYVGAGVSWDINFQ